MKKKIVFFILIITIILSAVTFNYANTTEEEEEEVEVVETNKTEYELDETIELAINTEKIDYTYSKITVQSDNIDTDDLITTETDDEQVVEKDDEQVIIYLDKTTDTIKTIALYYSISSDLSVGDTITFTVQILNCEDEEDYETIEITVTLVEETSDETESSESSSESETSSSSGNMYSSQNSGLNQSEQNMGSSENSGQNMSNADKSMSSDAGYTNSSELSSTTTSSIQGNSKESSSEQTVTYNGSSNNYLSELSIDGYDFKEAFCKENLTYFVSVDEGVESLEITATAEESTSSVTIYGNDSLSSGTNKMLVFVTAEDGSVRTYRIYAFK